MIGLKQFALKVDFQPDSILDNIKTIHDLMNNPAAGRLQGIGELKMTVRISYSAALMAC